MTATERVRELLDERGVEWDYGITGSTTTMFSVNGIDITFTPLRDGLVCSTILTPEQAIAATLGSFNCTDSERTNETCRNISKVIDEHGQARFACSECGAWIDSRMLWNPEYRNGESPWVSGCKLNFCPNCGRKVVDE